ncbi:MAG TPA: glycosyltransferase 87 family protein [Chloroflexota bacterium]|nr:glycosyltransferase 87 family protein [Chloroflexota bacterium]
MQQSAQRLSRLPSSLPLSSRVVSLLLFAGLSGVAFLSGIAVMGPTRLVGMQATWLMTFVILLVGFSLWWAIYLRLLTLLGGLNGSEAIGRSLLPILLLDLSIVPNLAVLLVGKLPYSMTFDANVQSLFQWMAGSTVFVVFVMQELVLLGAARNEDLRRLAGDAIRTVSVVLSRVGERRNCFAGRLRSYWLLLIVMLAGFAVRLTVIWDAHPGDMSDTLSVAYSILSWPPFGYYHSYRPQTSVYAHLPLYPVLIAPFYWVFENIAKLPTMWVAKLISAVADLVVAVMIYRQAKGHWRQLWGTVLSAAYLLSPLVISSDDHAVPTAAAFTIAAFASLERPWLCGLMIALASATRNEAAFFGLPLVIHFLFRRQVQEWVVFLGVYLTTLVAFALPFVLTDPEAIDYAMRRQSLRQAAPEVSSLLTVLQPHLSQEFYTLLQKNPLLLTLVGTLSGALLAVRDRRVMRVALVVGTVYVMTLPVLHPRYLVFIYGGGLFYAARYGNPLIALAFGIATWPGIPFGPTLQLVMVAILTICGLLQVYWPRRATRLAPLTQ